VTATTYLLFLTFRHRRAGQSSAKAAWLITDDVGARSQPRPINCREIRERRKQTVGAERFREIAAQSVSRPFSAREWVRLQTYLGGANQIWNQSCNPGQNSFRSRLSNSAPLVRPSMAACLRASIRRKLCPTPVAQKSGSRNRRHAITNNSLRTVRLCHIGAFIHGERSPMRLASAAAFLAKSMTGPRKRYDRRLAATCASY
jgi:hypothetical protein